MKPFSTFILKRLLVAAILEFGPLFLFLLCYKHLHIYKATFILMIMTILSTLLTYHFQKRLPYVALYVAFLTIIFGYLTISFHQPKFIQVRDTLYDITFALTLLGGLMYNVSFLKNAFHKVLPMTDRAWERITYLWAIFFILGAIVNEYIRRTMGIDSWISYKGIMVPITIVFGLIVLYFYYEKDKDHKS